MLLYFEKRITSPVAAQRAVYARAKTLEGRMARDVLKALSELGEILSEGELVKILNETTNPDEIFAQIRGNTEAVASKLAPTVAEGVTVGADTAVSMLPKAIGPKVVTFDPLRHKVWNWINANTASLVTGISQDTRKVISDTVLRGVMEGKAPRSLAKDLKRNIGLTDRQATALEKYRTKLVADGKPQSVVDRMVKRERGKKLKYRAKVIARTESISALNKGRESLWDQLRESGDMPENMVQRWYTATDERVCPTCGPLHNTTEKLGATFSSGPFSVTAPPLHPQCRCTVLLEYAK